MPKQKLPTRRDRVVTFLIGITVGALGTLSSLYMVHWFVAILPGPQVNGVVSGIRFTKANAAGCICYNLTINTDQAIEYVYLKAQFPGKINSYKVGLPQEAHTVTGRMAVQAWEIGTDSSGNCTVVQAAVNDSADVQASAVGNMISIHASKLPVGTSIMGIVVTTEGQSSTIRPAPAKIYTEGAFEYSKLGQTVRKVLSISDRGLQDAK